MRRARTVLLTLLCLALVVPVCVAAPSASLRDARMEITPVLEEPAGVDLDAARMEVLQRLAAYGLGQNQAEGPVEEIRLAALDGVIAEDAITAIASLLPPDLSSKAEVVLRAYAETIAWGESRTSPWISFPGAPEVPHPLNNGTCQACGYVDFGPFTPTTSCQYHGETTDGNCDCNWYSFNVVQGLTYTFTFCSGTCGGAWAFYDIWLDLVDSNCVGIMSNDDYCGLSSQLSWTATYTGIVYLRVAGWACRWGSYSLGYYRTGALCGSDADCDDANPCTDDHCDPATGCSHTNNTAACSDGNACTTGDYCAGGGCMPGTPVLCDDRSVCTADSCDPATGCVFRDLGRCNDRNACTQDFCNPFTGQCTYKPVLCDDGNRCTADYCDPRVGCLSIPIGGCF